VTGRALTRLEVVEAVRLDGITGPVLERERCAAAGADVVVDLRPTRSWTLPGQKSLHGAQRSRNNCGVRLQFHRPRWRLWLSLWSNRAQAPCQIHRHPPAPDR